MAEHFKLEQLFRRCDADGNGYISQQEFSALCQEFDISETDSDVIFADLDHDGDGRINFEDFAFGFRDFLLPGSRRGSVQLGILPLVSHPSPGHYEVQDGSHLLHSPIDMEKQRHMQENHLRAQKAWQTFADNMGRDNVKKFLASSGEKMLTLFEELKDSDAPTHLVEGFEDALSSLLRDVKNIENEQSRMEEMFNRERETHSAHLASIEAEMDQQVAKVEAAVRAQAKMDFENDRKAMQDKMEAEINELQSHLRLFQKVDQWMNKEEVVDNDAKKKLDDATQENRQLKALLSETQTNVAVMRSEMSQIKNQYETKINEITNEKENMMEYVYEYENLQSQLQLLHDANKKLQDANDDMRNMVDMSAIRSPAVVPRSETHSFTLNSLEVATSDGFGTEIAKLDNLFKKNKQKFLDSQGNSDFGGSVFGDTDSVRSRDCERIKSNSSSEAKYGMKPHADVKYGMKGHSDVKYGINRLMEDLDSGHSTLPGEDDQEDHARNPYFPSDLEKELENAEAMDSLEDDFGSNYVIVKEGGRRTADGTDTESTGNQSAKDDDLSASFTPDDYAPRSFQHHAPFRKSYMDVRVSGGDFYDHQAGMRRTNSVRSGHSSLSLYIPPRMDSPMIKMRANHQIPQETYSPLRDLEPTGPPDRTYKVVFAGDAAVGKTSFINRITKGVFLSNLSSTLGVDFQVKTIRVDDRNIAIQLWDTAGQERFRSVTKTYFRRADGVMLLYDVTSDRSFSSVRQWVDSIDEVSEKRIPIILCGNKSDMRTSAIAEGRRCVLRDDGEKMARDYSAIFLETSSKDGTNIMDSLVCLAREMCSSEDVEVQTSALKLREAESRGNCCSQKKRRSSLVR